MSDETALATHFDRVSLPSPAKAWLLDLWHVIQVLDDAQDGDAAGDQVGRAAMAIFWTMPLNEFYRGYQASLQPVLLAQLIKWQAANAAEAAHQAGPKSYMWRAGYYDVVAMVCHLCGVPHPGQFAMTIYGETFAEYMEGQQCPVL